MSADTLTAANLTALANGAAGNGGFPGVKGYLAPGLLTTFFQALECGIWITQSLRFWHNAKDEKPLIKVMVGFVTTVAL